MLFANLNQARHREPAADQGDGREHRDRRLPGHHAERHAVLPRQHAGQRAEPGVVVRGAHIREQVEDRPPFGRPAVGHRAHPAGGPYLDRKAMVPGGDRKGGGDPHRVLEIILAVGGGAGVEHDHQPRLVGHHVVTDHEFPGAGGRPPVHEP